MFCTVSDPSSSSSSLSVAYNESMEAEVDVRENGRWNKRHVALYRQYRLSDSSFVIRRKKGGLIEKEYALDSLCGIMIESKEGDRFPLLITFPRDLIRIRFHKANSIQSWKRFMERICGDCTVISSLTLEHTPFIRPFTTL
ncbi:hypothetical protein PENTCL1PPCAC_17490, partial [Pristionchus entomophagus]